MKKNSPTTGRAISDRELELLLRRTPEYCKLRQGRLLKKVLSIRKTTINAA